MVKVGCDILRIKRIEEKMKDEKFIGRFFSNEEIEIFEKRGNKAQTVAGNFCAKEAYVKALGCGFGKIRPKDISVLRRKSGEPYLVHNGQEYSVSISHEGDYAFAVIALEE